MGVISVTHEVYYQFPWRNVMRHSVGPHSWLHFRHRNWLRFEHHYQAKIQYNNDWHLYINVTWIKKLNCRHNHVAILYRMSRDYYSLHTLDYPCDWPKANNRGPKKVGEVMIQVSTELKAPVVLIIFIGIWPIKIIKTTGAYSSVWKPE